MKRMKGYMSNGLLLNYMIVMLTFSIGVSYLVTEGCAASMMLAKFMAGSLVVGLWYLMAHNFLNHKCTINSIAMMISVTFFACMNVLILITMDKLHFQIDFENLIVSGVASLAIVVALASSSKLKHFMREYHAKHNHHGPHAS